MNLEIVKGSIVQAKTDIEYCHRHIKGGERFKVLSDLWTTSGSCRRGKWETTWAQICVDEVVEVVCIKRDFNLVHQDCLCKTKEICCLT